MKPYQATARPLAALVSAVQCALTLVAIMGVIGVIGCLAGIASLSDLPWILAGAFMGSLIMAMYRHETERVRRR